MSCRRGSPPGRRAPVVSLPPAVQEEIRSGANITSAAQCVKELVRNALDAGASCVAVRVNLPQLEVQVVDNGAGMTPELMARLGDRYVTTRGGGAGRPSTSTFGYRGESLASLARVCRRLEITSRRRGSEQTWRRRLTRISHSGKARRGVSPADAGRASAGEGAEQNVTGRPKTGTAGNSAPSPVSQQRPSSGTTVTVQGLFAGRRACRRPLELESVCRVMETLALPRPDVSFSLRDDTTGRLLMDAARKPSVLERYSDVIEPITEQQTRPLTARRGKIRVSGFTTLPKSKQFVFVNGRLTARGRLHRLAARLLASVQPVIGSPTSRPGFVLMLRCPAERCSVVYDPDEDRVEFANWEPVQTALERAMKGTGTTAEGGQEEARGEGGGIGNDATIAGAADAAPKAATATVADVPAAAPACNYLLDRAEARRGKRVACPCGPEQIGARSEPPHDVSVSEPETVTGGGLGDDHSGVNVPDRSSKKKEDRRSHVTSDQQDTGARGDCLRQGSPKRTRAVRDAGSNVGSTSRKRHRSLKQNDQKEHVSGRKEWAISWNLRAIDRKEGSSGGVLPSKNAEAAEKRMRSEAMSTSAEDPRVNVAHQPPGNLHPDVSMTSSRVYRGSLELFRQTVLRAEATTTAAGGSTPTKDVPRTPDESRCPRPHSPPPLKRPRLSDSADEFGGDTMVTTPGGRRRPLAELFGVRRTAAEQSQTGVSLGNSSRPEAENGLHVKCTVPEQALPDVRTGAPDVRTGAPDVRIGAPDVRTGGQNVKRGSSNHHEAEDVRQLGFHNVEHSSNHQDPEVEARDLFIRPAQTRDSDLEHSGSSLHRHAASKVPYRAEQYGIFELDAGIASMPSRATSTPLPHCLAGVLPTPSVCSAGETITTNYLAAYTPLHIRGRSSSLEESSFSIRPVIVDSRQQAEDSIEEFTLAPVAVYNAKAARRITSEEESIVVIPSFEEIFSRFTSGELSRAVRCVDANAFPTAASFYDGRNPQARVRSDAVNVPQYISERAASVFAGISSLLSAGRVASSKEEMNARFNCLPALSYGPDTRCRTLSLWSSGSTHHRDFVSESDVGSGHSVSDGDAGLNGGPSSRTLPRHNQMESAHTGRCLQPPHALETSFTLQPVNNSFAFQPVDTSFALKPVVCASHDLHPPPRDNCASTAVDPDTVVSRPAEVPMRDQAVDAATGCSANSLGMAVSESGDAMSVVNTVPLCAATQPFSVGGSSREPTTRDEETTREEVDASTDGSCEVRASNDQGDVESESSEYEEHDEDQMRSVQENSVHETEMSAMPNENDSSESEAAETQYNSKQDGDEEPCASSSPEDVDVSSRETVSQNGNKNLESETHGGDGRRHEGESSDTSVLDESRSASKTDPSPDTAECAFIDTASTQHPPETETVTQLSVERQGRHASADAGKDALAEPPERHTFQTPARRRIRPRHRVRISQGLYIRISPVGPSQSPQLTYGMNAYAGKSSAISVVTRLPDKHKTIDEQRPGSEIVTDDADHQTPKYHKQFGVQSRSTLSAASELSHQDDLAQRSITPGHTVIESTEDHECLNVAVLHNTTQQSATPCHTVVESSENYASLNVAVLHGTDHSLAETCVRLDSKSDENCDSPAGGSSDVSVSEVSPSHNVNGYALSLSSAAPAVVAESEGDLPESLRRLAGATPTVETPLGAAPSSLATLPVLSTPLQDHTPPMEVRMQKDNMEASFSTSPLPSTGFSEPLPPSLIVGTRRAFLVSQSRTTQSDSEEIQPGQVLKSANADVPCISLSDGTNESGAVVQDVKVQVMNSESESGPDEDGDRLPRMPRVLVDVIPSEDIFTTPTRNVAPGFNRAPDIRTHGVHCEEALEMMADRTPDDAEVSASEASNLSDARRRLFSSSTASEVVRTVAPARTLGGTGNQSSVSTAQQASVPPSLAALLATKITQSLQVKAPWVRAPQAQAPPPGPPQPPQPAPPRPPSPVWHQVTDPAGRSVFVNSATGHTSLAPPTFTGAADKSTGAADSSRSGPAARPLRPLMVVTNEELPWCSGSFGFQRPLLLTHGFSPFLPRGRLRLPPPPTAAAAAEVDPGEQCLPPDERQTAQRVRTVADDVTFERPVASLGPAPSAACRLQTCDVTADMLQEVRVFRQVENKFIAACAGDVVLLFDQHAVSERINLENILRDAGAAPGSEQLRSCRLSPPLELRLPGPQLRLLSQHPAVLERLGFVLGEIPEENDSEVAGASHHETALVSLLAVPACLCERAERDWAAQRAAAVLSELAEQLTGSRGAAAALPRTLLDVYHSMACHSAVRFGDPLPAEVCERLVTSLAGCQRPLVCAHGRPSVIPLLNWTRLPTEPQEPRPRLERLRRRVAGAAAGSKAVVV